MAWVSSTSSCKGQRVWYFWHFLNSSWTSFCFWLCKVWHSFWTASVDSLRFERALSSSRQFSQFSNWYYFSAGRVCQGLGFGVSDSPRKRSHQDMRPGHRPHYLVYRIDDGSSHLGVPCRPFSGSSSNAHLTCCQLNRVAFKVQRVEICQRMSGNELNSSVIWGTA